jgi:hypothetical protein
MMYLTIGLFALSAVLGITILVSWLNKKNVSRAVVYSHGIAAAIALGLLVWYAVEHPGNFPRVSLILFGIAAIGGFYMFFLDLKKKPGPMAVAFIHGLLAVAGFVMLLAFVFI